MPKSFYIIDGHAQIYRSYYAPFRPLTSPSGEPTKATYVFFSTLFNLIRRHRPDYLAMALDVSDASVFRTDIFPQYKANRDPPPEDLPPQADRIISMVQAMGIPTLRKQGFEADDLMATLVERFARDDLSVYLVSRDKDLEQLIGDSAFLFDPAKDRVIDRQFLLQEKGYAPEQAVDIQTLSGDNVDNVPGVAGIGQKTAAKLINTYGSADAVLANADKLTPKQSENVKAFAGQMALTRELVTLRRDVAFEFELESARFDGVDVDQVKPIFVELGFTKLVEQLEGFRKGSCSPPPPPPKEAGHPGAVPLVPESTATAAGRYTLIDSVEKLVGVVRELARVQVFAIDTETTSLNPVAANLAGISLCWQSGAACYIPIRAAVGDVLSLDDVRRHLGPILADPRIGKIGQNIKYDAVVLKQAGLELAGITFDTMIASFALEPLRWSHGLNALAKEICDHSMIPISDLIGKGKNQITIDQAPLDQVCEYASEDADFTWRIAEVLHPQIAASPVRPLFEETEMPLVEVLVQMEHNGVTLDSDLLVSMSVELAERIDALVGEIQGAAGYAFNIDSPKQLAGVLFDDLGLPVLKKTKTGRSTDAGTLETLVEKTDHPVPRLMLTYRELTKLKNTYLDPLPGMVCPRTGRLHASFHQTGAITGRLSSSNPNLQNIPIRTDLGRRIRGAFVAGDPESVLVVADYSQIELRVLAHFCRDEALLEAFRTGQDIHASMAAQVGGIDVSDVTPEQRSAAKAVNFGIVYGQTPFGLAKSLGVSQGEARDFIDRYHGRYPGIKIYIDQCVAETRSQGFAETILGRRRPIAELGSRNRQQVALGERLAVNTVIQGSAADLIKRAMIDIHREIVSGKLATRMLIQVHDELVFEVRKSDVESHTRMIREKMAGAIALDVPIVVDIGVGETWLDAK